MTVLTEERRKQAIISEHFLDTITVIKVHIYPVGRALDLMFGVDVPLVKISKIVRKISKLTQIRVISFAIGYSYLLLFDNETKKFYEYLGKHKSKDTMYKTLTAKELQSHLRFMKSMSQ